VSGGRGSAVSPRRAIIWRWKAAGASEGILDSFLNEYQPQGPTEQQLVRTLANNSWHLDRVNRLEEALFTNADETSRSTPKCARSPA